jgi:hypothetical protein
LTDKFRLVHPPRWWHWQCVANFMLVASEHKFDTNL